MCIHSGWAGFTTYDMYDIYDVVKGGFISLIQIIMNYE